MSAELASVRSTDAPAEGECSMAPLVEAKRDGRLGEREAASLARHVAGCATCRTLERELDDVRSLLRGGPMPPISPLEHQRGRLALLRAAAAPPPPRARSMRPFALAGAAAAVALACLAVAAPRHLATAPVTVARHIPTDVLRAPAALLEAAPNGGSGESPLVLAETAFEPTPSSPSSTQTQTQAYPHRDRQGAEAAAKPGAPSSPRPPLPIGRGAEKEAAAEAAASADDASRDFNEAVQLMGRGDYAAAGARLDAFRAAHPSDARADLASFLTIVSLQHAGRRAEAQEAARRYLETYPNGDRRAEVLQVAAGQ